LFCVLPSEAVTGRQLPLWGKGGGKGIDSARFSIKKRPKEKGGERKTRIVATITVTSLPLPIGSVGKRGKKRGPIGGTEYGLGHEKKKEKEGRASDMMYTIRCKQGKKREEEKEDQP